MLELFQLDHSLTFPSIELALDEPNGLLAFGGDLSVERLCAAYYEGIFPWFGDNDPLLWWSPDPRGIIVLDAFYCSKSLRKAIRRENFTVTLNTAFEQVIKACATIARRSPSGEHETVTWITPQMRLAYCALHQATRCHSVEVWQGDELVGGLYGVNVGGVFCGESMFHKVPNASKVASLALVQHMRAHNMAFIDCQMPTDHLMSLGCEELDRNDFIRGLQKYRDDVFPSSMWAQQSLTKLIHEA